MHKTFTDTRKTFADERKRLILEELDASNVPQDDRYALAERIARRMGEYDRTHFNSQGQWTGNELTDC